MTAALEAVHAHRVAADGLGLERVAHAGALWITLTPASQHREPFCGLLPAVQIHFHAADGDGIDVARVVGAADCGKEGEIDPGTALSVRSRHLAISRPPAVPASLLGEAGDDAQPAGVTDRRREFGEPDVVHAPG